MISRRLEKPGEHNEPKIIFQIIRDSNKHTFEGCCRDSRLLLSVRTHENIEIQPRPPYIVPTLFFDTKVILIVIISQKELLGWFVSNRVIVLIQRRVVVMVRCCGCCLIGRQATDTGVVRIQIFVSKHLLLLLLLMLCCCWSGWRK